MSQKIDWTTLLPNNTSAAVLVGETEERYIYCIYATDSYSSTAGGYKEVSLETGQQIHGILSVVGQFIRATGGGIEQAFPFGTAHVSGNGVELSSTCYTIPQSGSTKVNLLMYNRQSQLCKYAVRVYFTVNKNI